ncbi:MAG: protein kinase [Chloroflexi bacterium]|nr:protein kinase [Chloroflexota bacterium]
MSTELSGQVLNQYELLDVLGKGGMAVVYRARQTNINRFVAMKVMSNTLAGDTDFLDRFRHEADLIAKLEHPNILPIYDYGSAGDYFYLVLRLMDGGSLDGYMNGNPMALQDVDRFLVQIASALDFAHQHRVVHRDLKPNNVLLDRHGNAYLMDFGIAKVISDSNLTTTNTIMGTPGYMAPEQWKLTPFDHRIDVYSLGIMTYEMLTGSTPFIGQTPLQYMYAHLHEQIPRPSNFVYGLSPEVDKVLMRATAKDPKRRYPTAGEFAAAFSAALRGEKVSADGVPVVTKPARGASGKPAQNILQDVLVDLELSSDERRSPAPKLDQLLETPNKSNSAEGLDDSDLAHLLEDVLDILGEPAPTQPEGSAYQTTPLPETQPDESHQAVTKPHELDESSKSSRRIPAIRLHDLLDGLTDLPVRTGLPTPKASDLLQPTSTPKPPPKRSERMENLLSQLVEQPAEKKVRVHLNMMDLLSYGGKRQRSLGVNAQQVRLPPSLEAQVGQATGLMLLGVDSDGPADRAGLFLGDILIAANDQRLQHLDDLNNVLTYAAAEFQMIRAGQLQNIQVSFD